MHVSDEVLRLWEAVITEKSPFSNERGRDRQTDRERQRQKEKQTEKQTETDQERVENDLRGEGVR